MDMLLDVFSSAGFGGLIGGVFGYLGKREERKNIQMKLDHEIDKINAQTSAAIKISDNEIKANKVEGQLAVERSEATAFEKSQEVFSKFSEGVKALIRPVILGVLMFQTYKILTSLESITGGLDNFSPDEVLGLYRVVVLSIIGLTSTAVGWYFAARSSKQFDKLIDKWDI